MENLKAVLAKLAVDIEAAGESNIEEIMSLKAKADSDFAAYVKGIKARVTLDRERVKIEGEIKVRQDRLAELEAQASGEEIA